jgi:hypothetical protein
MAHPTRHLLDRKDPHKYTPACATDVRKTMERYLRELKKQQLDKEKSNSLDCKAPCST